MLAWEEWEALDLEVPGKAELYSAQVALEVARIPGAVWGSPPALKLAEFVLRRQRPKTDGPVKPLTAEERRVAIMNASKARAITAVGGESAITYVYIRPGGG